jgi:hypothetical protein
VPASYTPGAPLAAASRATKSQKRQPIWLPAWPTLMVITSCGMRRGAAQRAAAVTTTMGR